MTVITSIYQYNVAHIYYLFFWLMKRCEWRLLQFFYSALRVKNNRQFTSGMYNVPTQPQINDRLKLNRWVNKNNASHKLPIHIDDDSFIYISTTHQFNAIIWNNFKSWAAFKLWAVKCWLNQYFGLSPFFFRCVCGGTNAIIDIFSVYFWSLL